jgi:hypothetical protein
MDHFPTPFSWNPPILNQRRNSIGTVYNGEYGPELHPHLTLARFEKPEQADEVSLPTVPTFTFTVDKIHLYLGSATEDIAFIPRAVIPLGPQK